MSDEANVWNPKTVIQIQSNTKSVEELITASAGQATFTLQDFVYVLGTGGLEVHKNGLLLAKGIDWVESTVSTFSLTTPAIAGDKIIALGHVGITGTVDVRDTDIYVANYQAIRDYSGTEITLYSQGKLALVDGGDNFFQKKTGAAPGFYVDNNYNVIVPTGGDGSTGWVNDKRAFTSIANTKKIAFSPDVVVETTSYLDGWAATVKGPIGGGQYVVVSKADHDIVRATSTVDELIDHTLSNANVLLFTPREGKVTATQCGAVGNDTATDTTAVQAFIRFCEKNPVDGDMEGLTYLCGALNIGTDTTFRNGKIHALDSLLANVPILLNDNWNAAGATVDNNIIIENVEFISTDLVDRSESFVTLARCGNLYLNKITITNPLHAGLDIGGSEGVKVLDYKARGTGKNTVSVAGGPALRCGLGTGFPSKDVHIINPDIQNCEWSGITCSGTRIFITNPLIVLFPDIIARP